MGSKGRMTGRSARTGAYRVASSDLYSTGAYAIPMGVLRWANVMPTKLLQMNESMKRVRREGLALTVAELMIDLEVCMARLRR